MNAVAGCVTAFSLQSLGGGGDGHSIFETQGVLEEKTTEGQ